MINNNDTFISDDEAGEDDTCPLCVEEMDISDKNFKPCPCGYQICQFCYNNIRQNPDLNGRCPACRRPYDDESVEYKQLSPEEWRLEQNKQSRREKERKQKEKEKKENEQLNRKHLAGMRVIQKNLVYIVGLNPPVPPEELHTVLRSDKYFGQFGKILKIVVNKRNPITGLFTGTGGVGVYVTFSKKEEAAKCISAVDGSYMDGKPLKAAFGTTKYCSSYLRGQSCPNPNCMFLHEPGEEADSYTRQDLSTRQSLKMGGAEGFKMPAPFPRSSSGYFNDDSHSSSGNPSPAPTNNTPLATASSSISSSHQSGLHDSNPLPATASWASKTGNTAVASPSEEPEILANSSAFPTLGESVSLHHQQQQQQQNHPPHVQSKKNKNQNQRPDEFSPEETATTFVEELITDLKALPYLNFDVREDVLTDAIISSPPLFSFHRAPTTPRCDRGFNRRLVHALITQTARPNVIPVQQQQQQMPPPAVQVAVPQSQTPTQAQLQLNDFIQQQQHRAASQGQQIPQQQQQFFQQQQQQQQQNSVAQALLQQQLLQHQAAAHLQAQHPQPVSNAPQQLLHEQLLQQQNSVLNGAKNDRAFAATPPPGMFATTQQNNEQGASGTASELLSHLMNGKKISA